MPIALPAILEALEIALSSFAVVLGLMFVFYVAILLVKALLHPLKGIPFGVGSWLYHQVDSIAETFHALISQELSSRVTHLSAFLVSLGHEISVSWDAVADFSTTLAADLEHWTTTGLHDVIKSFTNAVLTVANRAHALAEAAQADVIELGKGLDLRFDNLRRWVETEVFGRAMAGIDALRSDILDRAIPAVEQEIGSAVGTLRGEIVTVEHGVEAIGKDLADLAKALGIPLSVIEALIAAVGLTAAIDAIETLGRCSGKLKTMCTSDPFRWAQLIEGLALLAFWPGLIELTRMAQGILESELPALHDTIVKGQRT